MVSRGHDKHNNKHPHVSPIQNWKTLLAAECHMHCADPRGLTCIRTASSPASSPASSSGSSSGSSSASASRARPLSALHSTPTSQSSRKTSGGQHPMLSLLKVEQSVDPLPQARGDPSRIILHAAGQGVGLPRDGVNRTMQFTRHPYEGSLGWELCC